MTGKNTQATVLEDSSFLRRGRVWFYLRKNAQLDACGHMLLVGEGTSRIFHLHTQKWRGVTGEAAEETAGRCFYPGHQSQVTTQMLGR